jgi:hypothetical protein
VQLPQDAAKHLAVLAPRLATPAVGRQQRLHAGERFVGEFEHRACSRAGCFQGRDAIELHSRQQQNAAVVLVAIIVRVNQEDAAGRDAGEGDGACRRPAPPSCC